MVQLENLSKVYRTPRGEVKALDNVSFQVKDGEFFVIRGPSGSGKTTLLLTTGGMLQPTQGQVIVDGNNVYGMSKHIRAKFRAEKIGFVFQMFHLIPYLNVIENVLLATSFSSHNDKRTRAEAKELLEHLNLSGREYHRPSELSTGEKQRIAIARALFSRPKIILADEPTGNLDPENAADVFGYLSEYHQNGGTVIVATHGIASDKYADSIVHLQEGRIEL